jgi:hydroxymethylpyrimidine/phosphomethylpyrimidine kinase
MGAVVCSIGTTHPWNIAGVGLDIRLGPELGAHVVTVVAAVSAQDARGVHALEPTALPVLHAQLAAIPWDDVAAVRIGALPTPDAVAAIAQRVVTLDVPAVIDPVLAASRGGALTGAGTLAAIRAMLLPLPNAIVTPNLDEAEALLGRAIARDELESAASELRAHGARAVLLKGGHIIGDPIDVLATSQGTLRYEEPRIPGEIRGTGCMLAIALASELANGKPLLDAVRFARGFVRAKIAQANL